MKQASLIVVGFLMLLSCQTGSISRKLTEVDSLVFKEEYDSAYQMISSIDETTIKNQEDQAHYNLLKVQTGYLANKPAASPDSLLDEVIDYYQKHLAVGIGYRRKHNAFAADYIAASQPAAVYVKHSRAVAFVPCFI